MAKAFVLVAQAIAYQISDQYLLEPLSMTVFPGKILMLVGPNGAGKSTLLNLLSGGLAPTQGQVFLEDKPLALYAHKARARRIAYLVQFSELFTDMRVLDLVMLGRYPYKESSDVSKKNALQALEKMGLEPLRHLFYKKLSGGQRQLVQLARVLAQVDHEGGEAFSRYLLLDEPTTYLDDAHRNSLFELLKNLRTQNVGIVMATHHVEQVLAYADQVMVLKNGQHVATGEASAVLALAK